MRLLPTPNASEAYKASAADHQNSISRMVKRNELLPTPRTPTNNGIGYAKNAGKSRLEDVIPEKMGLKTSQLNPRFVLEMMGFPPNWTELPFQNGEKRQ